MSDLQTIPDVQPPRQRNSPAVAGGKQVVLIKSRKGWMSINFREIWDYRELLYFLVWRDIKVRYKQTVLGAAWGIIQPVFNMIVFTVIFGMVAKLQTPGGVPYPIFVYAGLLPWTLFSGSVSASGLSLLNETQLLTKVYFPRLLAPMANTGVPLVDFGFSFLVYIGLMVYYQHLPGLSVLLLPVLLLISLVCALGIGCAVASVIVKYRDFRSVIPFMLQVWMYASPVIYPANLVPDRYQWLLALNPMTGVIQAFRACLLNQPVEWGLLGISAGISAGLFVFGIYNFRRTERQIADIV